jgi:AraC-like DNA-binding protein
VVGARGAERVAAWRPRVAGIREVLHAEFFAHAYPPHTHDTWTLLVVDHGEIRYALDRHLHGARRSMVSLLPPDVVQHGRPATHAGYRKRVVYLERGVVDDRLAGRAVDRPFVEDAPLRRAVDALHEALRDRDDALAAEVRLALVVERLVEHLSGRPAARDPGDAGASARALRDLLDARTFEPVSIGAAAAALGVSPAHLARSFTRTFGISPHAYVVGRRIDAARTRLLDGQPIASVAADVGFFDQAHLTRHFKRHVGMTPGRFARVPS